MRIIAALAVMVAASWSLPLGAQSRCTGPNGSRFNLEPRPSAVVQAAQSVAVLPGAGLGGVDLVLATSTDMRGIAGTNDEFFVQRANANCTADLEGGIPQIQNILGFFAGFGTPTAVADPAHGAFFIVDLRTGGGNQNAVGIVRANATTLLNTANCPAGTESQGSAGCFTAGAVTNVTSLNAFLDSPHLAVDQRTAGVGAGDVYTVVAQRSPDDSSKTIRLTACTNRSINCGESIVINGGAGNVDFPYVQVRPDGGVTVTYLETAQIIALPQSIKFVTCEPNGAPEPPTCTPPTLVITDQNGDFAFQPGAVPMAIGLYPRHAHRLESDGETITTFLTYDRCAVSIQHKGLGPPFCPRADVVFTTSSDNGMNWSPLEQVSTGGGQKFLSSMAVDDSTGTVNIGYYSTENDLFGQRPQVFLAQIPSGTTSPTAPQLLTQGFGDVQAISPLTVLFQPTGFGDRLGIAAVGTGIAGQSRVYIGFTWNSVFGKYAGVPSPDMNNHLTQFAY